MSGSLLQEQLHSKFGIEIDMSQPFTAFRWPLWGVAFYFLTVRYFQPSKIAEQKKIKEIREKKKNRSAVRRTFGAMEQFIFAHNAILCIFSLLCFINTSPLVYRLVAEEGYANAICGGLDKLYDTSFGYWCHLFYLSKFYEFIDSWIVIARGRRPILLQVYHHIGAVYGMWMIVITRSTGGYLFVCENSFIHTIMYFYYALSVLGYRFRTKFVITLLQMTQFIIGLGLCSWQLAGFSNCLRWEDKVCLGYHIAYVSILFALFAQFYRRTYAPKPKSS